MIPGNKHGICKLCGKDRQLCESHIVPEFCHKQIYDEKHRIFERQFKDGELHKRTRQKGRREYLLCSECEGILNKYETSFSKYWYGPNGLPDRIDGDHVLLQNADCHKFKLFHLSVIWRASVSTEFGSISLGPYNDKIRKILLNDNPIPQSHYPIIGCVLTDDDGCVVHEQVSAPIKSQNDGSTCYTLSYAACDWMFVITDHPMRKQTNLGEAISADGQITLLSKHFTEAPVGQATIKALRGFRKENKG